MDAIDELHHEILACRRCQDSGYIEIAAPVVSGRQWNRMMLIGQAPGMVERTVRRPFAGKAGRELFRWLRTIEIDEEAFRNQVYMTAVTKCFPGRVVCGAGDRRPSAKEIALCSPWLEAQLALVKPETIFLVGGLAIERYLPRLPLVELIGNRFDRAGKVLIPLPHPSGASRWLNLPEHKALLHRALGHVRAEWDRCMVDSSNAMCIQQMPGVDSQASLVSSNETVLRPHWTEGSELHRDEHIGAHRRSTS